MQNLNIKKRCYKLDFEKNKASVERYAIHDYPAMLHYLVVRTILEHYGEDKKVLYDPFCGSGVTLCEGLKKNMEVYGTDINPLALLIAKTRCSNIDDVPIEKIKQQIKYSKPDIPNIKNCEYWFKDYVVEHLGKLRATIKLYYDEKFYNLLLVAFSQTVRDVSNNRKGEFKRFRLDDERLKKFTPDVFKTYEKNLVTFLNYLKKDFVEGKYNLFRVDIKDRIPFSKKVDIVITSPPYGDSRTTVAYGQFSSFSLDWIKGLNPFGDADLKLDKESLGGTYVKENRIDFSETLKKVYLELNQINKKRAEEIKAFFMDLFKCCKNINKILHKNSIVCFIVGNRKVNNIQIPMDDIVKETFGYLGLKHRETLVREIHNKRMPLQNSPTNEIGQKADTMKYEYIVLMEKTL